MSTAHARGFTDADERMLDADEAREMLAADGRPGWVVHTALRDGAPCSPGARTRAVVEACGAHIFEQTTVRSIGPGRVETDAGTVRAEVVLRATEGYTPQLEGHRRVVAPVYSLMVATEPLDDATWASIGLGGVAGKHRPTFSDARHLIIYGQRTADGRLAFGGRGAPYHFGSRIRPSYDVEPRVFEDLRGVLRDMLPQLGAEGDGVRFTHQWGGCLGIARDWAASVGLDRQTGIGWAGGYVGDGVATTNLAGSHPRRPGHRGRRPTWSRSPGSTTAAAGGSRNHCAGWGINAGLRATSRRRRGRAALDRPAEPGRAV